MEGASDMASDATSIVADRPVDDPDPELQLHRSVSQQPSSRSFGGRKPEVPGTQTLMVLMRHAASTHEMWGNKLPFLVVPDDNNTPILWSYIVQEQRWEQGQAAFQRVCQYARGHFAEFDKRHNGGWDLHYHTIQTLYKFVANLAGEDGVERMAAEIFYNKRDAYPSGVIPYQDLLFNIKTGDEYLKPGLEGDPSTWTCQTARLCYVTRRDNILAPSPEEWGGIATSLWGLRVREIFEQTFPTRGLREEVMWTLAAFLFEKGNELRRLLVLWGGTGAGKSWIQNILYNTFAAMRWVNTLNGTSFAAVKCSDNGAGVTHMLNQSLLFRLIFLSETAKHGQLSAQLIKSNTGNEALPHRKCHKDAEGPSLVPTAGFVQLSNDHVSLDTSGEAELKRVVCCKCPSFFATPGQLEASRAGEPVFAENGTELTVDRSKVFLAKNDPFKEVELGSDEERLLRLAVAEYMGEQYLQFDACTQLANKVRSLFGAALRNEALRTSTEWSVVSEGKVETFEELEALLSPTGDVFPRCVDYVTPPRLPDGNMVGDNGNMTLDEALKMVFVADPKSQDKISPKEALETFTSLEYRDFVPEQRRSIKQPDLSLAIQKLWACNADSFTGHVIKVASASKRDQTIDTSFKRTEARPIMVVNTTGRQRAFLGLSRNLTCAQRADFEERRQAEAQQREEQQRVADERQRKQDESSAEWRRMQPKEVFAEEVIQPAIALVTSSFQYDRPPYAEQQQFESLLKRATTAKKLQTGGSIPLWRLINVLYELDASPIARPNELYETEELPFAKQYAHTTVMQMRHSNPPELRIEWAKAIAERFDEWFVKMLREPYGSWSGLGRSCTMRRGRDVREPYPVEDGTVKGISEAGGASSSIRLEDGTVAHDLQPEGTVASRTRARSEASTPRSSSSKRLAPSPGSVHSFARASAAREDSDDDEDQEMAASSGGGQRGAA